MPTYKPIVDDIERYAEQVRAEMLAGKYGTRLVTLLFYILRGTDRNIRDLYRKFWGLEARRGGVAVGGGGETRAPQRIPLCTVRFESEQIGNVVQDDGSRAFQPMAPVVYPKWDRAPVRELFGVHGSHFPQAITGSLWIETLDGGLTEKRYYIAMTATTPVQAFTPAALIGFSVGFGRYGTERLQFRLDLYEYRRSGIGAEITTLTSEQHASSKWQTQETSGLITEALLTAYQAGGLRIKTTLTVWGT